tara:strand:- start:4367 stop:4504 length:138 start_codon:yes stop_codon:yes gene_type:complete
MVSVIFEVSDDGGYIVGGHIFDDAGFGGIFEEGINTFCMRDGGFE